MWQETPNRARNDPREANNPTKGRGHGAVGPSSSSHERRPPHLLHVERSSAEPSRKLPALSRSTEHVPEARSKAETSANARQDLYRSEHSRPTTLPNYASIDAKPAQSQAPGFDVSTRTPSTVSEPSKFLKQEPHETQGFSRASAFVSIPARTSLSIPDAVYTAARYSPHSAVSAQVTGSRSSPFGSGSRTPPVAPPTSRAMPQLPMPQLPGPDSISRPPAMSSGAVHATQYMTVETGNGPMSIPIDVQGASRVADEKRRRNAGASARFRARRKEKEMASSKEIEALKQRIDDLSEDCEFYRKERDILVVAVSNNPGLSSILPRPESPRRNRRTLYDPSTSRSEGSLDSPQIQRFEELGDQGGYGSVSRRRLDTPPSASYSYSAPSIVHAPTSHHHAILPPIETSQQQRGSATQLPAVRSVSYPGFATAQSLPPSPWQSGYPSQVHSRSQSSTRSYQSGTSAP